MKQSRQLEYWWTWAPAVACLTLISADALGAPGWVLVAACLAVGVGLLAGAVDLLVPERRRRAQARRASSSA
jgi:hypothetical protein